MLGTDGVRLSPILGILLGGGADVRRRDIRHAAKAQQIRQRGAKLWPGEFGTVLARLTLLEHDNQLRADTRNGLRRRGPQGGGTSRETLQTSE
jgi:hypothetical protein